MRAMAANLLTMRTPRKTIRPMRMSSRVPHTLIDMRQGYHRNKLGYNARHKKKYIDTDHAVSVNNQDGQKGQLQRCSASKRREWISAVWLTYVMNERTGIFEEVTLLQ